jgi:hypothetical protein
VDIFRPEFERAASSGARRVLPDLIAVAQWRARADRPANRQPPTGEPGRDQRDVQAVLERKAHAEIGGQAQGGDQLRAVGLLAALGRVG